MGKSRRCPRARIAPVFRPITARQLRIDSLEDRTVPATYAFANGVLSVDIDTPADILTLTAGPTQYQIAGVAPAIDGGGLTGVVNLLGGTATVVNPAAVKQVVITDSAPDATVAFADSGANAYPAEIDVNLDETLLGATSVQFQGATTINPPNPGATVEIRAGDIAF